MNDLKDLEFLAAKSKEMVEKQIASYRQKHSNAGTIIGVTALFIPFFLNGLENAYKWVKILSLIPVSLLVYSVILMLGVLRTKLLYQFFSPEKFTELVNKGYEEVLLFEIGANRASFQDNKIIDRNINKKYNIGIKLTTIAIVISAILLLTNKFYQPEKSPTKVQLINLNSMSDKDKPKEKPRVIPTVPQSDRERLNEGIDKPQNTPPPPPKPATKDK